MEHVCGDLVQEVPVVRDYQQGARPLLKITLKPNDGLQRHKEKRENTMKLIKKNSASFVNQSRIYKRINYNGTFSRHLKFVRYRRGDIRAAVKHSFFFCLGWLGQKHIRTYISKYQLQICCFMPYLVRKLAFLTI